MKRSVLDSLVAIACFFASFPPSTAIAADSRLFANLPVTARSLYQAALEAHTLFAAGSSVKRTAPQRAKTCAVDTPYGGSSNTKCRSSRSGSGCRTSPMPVPTC